MQPTMKDVAKLAGVSQPTVSHVINGTAPISGSVVKRVNEAIEQLGYIPNATAKSLKSRKSQIIGIIVPDVAIRFYAEMVKAIEMRLRKQGFMMFLCNTLYSNQLEHDYVRTLIQHNALGVIVGYSLLEENRGSCSNTAYHGFAGCQRHQSCGAPGDVDNQMLARMAVSHLCDAARISYCSCRWA